MPPSPTAYLPPGVQFLNRKRRDEMTLFFMKDIDMYERKRYVFNYSVFMYKYKRYSDDFPNSSPMSIQSELIE